MCDDAGQGDDTENGSDRLRIVVLSGGNSQRSYFRLQRACGSFVGKKPLHRMTDLRLDPTLVPMYIGTYGR